MTSKSAIHILTLLAETRLLIYKHYIHGMNAFLIKSIEQDTRLGGQDPSFEVRFKITLGDHEAPACDLELSRVCRNIRHELLPWLAANAGLEVMAKGDFPMMHPDMSVLPRWYAVGVRRVTFTDAETIRYCLLPLPSLHNVIIRLLNEEELKGFKKGVPRTRVALKDKELRNAVWQQTYEKFRAERERSFPYIQDQDFKLTVAVGFGRVTVLLAGKELIEGVSLVSQSLLNVPSTKLSRT